MQARPIAPYMLAIPRATRPKAGARGNRIYARAGSCRARLVGCLRLVPVSIELLEADAPGGLALGIPGPVAKLFAHAPLDVGEALAEAFVGELQCVACVYAVMA